MKKKKKKEGKKAPSQNALGWKGPLEAT